MTQINNINGSPAVQTGQRSGTSATGDFQGTLENALDKTSGNSAESGTIAALGEPQAINFSQGMPQPPTDVADQADNLLGLLESYADGLENPETSLKELSSLVDRIQEEAQQLMASADESTTAGSELKQIAEQTALTASMEYVKFQRGDYV